jgi:hypothetical protein
MGLPCKAQEGNFLESINLCLNIFQKHYKVMLAWVLAGVSAGVGVVLACVAGMLLVLAWMLVGVDAGVGGWHAACAGVEAGGRGCWRGWVAGMLLVWPWCWSGAGTWCCAWC